MSESIICKLGERRIVKGQAVAVEVVCCSNRSARHGSRSTVANIVKEPEHCHITRVFIDAPWIVAVHEEVLVGGEVAEVDPLRLGSQPVRVVKHCVYQILITVFPVDSGFQSQQ